jgi:hypothetical protein
MASNSATQQHQGSLFLGLIVCWLLNMVHIGIAYLVFISGERTLPTALVLVGAIGLLQTGYVAPIWYLLRRRGKKRMATGLALAAGITLLLNTALWLDLYGNGS